jgi:iron complex outermembrane receptor protein
MKTILFFSVLFSSVFATAQNDTLTARTTDSVTVTARKPAIKNLVDRTVLNVEAAIATAGMHALDLLRSAPGVVVDANDGISISGRQGVTVLIDGRNTQLAGQDLAQLLKSLDAGNIKEIEIITQPSSRFDAQGNAGIINIRLKKSTVRGINGNLSGNWIQSTDARQSASASVNARNLHWNGFAQAGINNGLQYVLANNDRNSGGKTWEQRGVERDEFNSANIRAGIDYMPDAKNTLGFLWMFNDRYTGMDNWNTTLVQQKSLPDTSVYTRSIAPFLNHRNALNLNYRYQHKENELNIDADWATFRSGLNNTVQTSAVPAGANSTMSANNASVRIDIKSLKADWIQQLQQQTTLEAGAKYTATRTDNVLDVQQQIAQQWKQDTGRSNLFAFNENILAGYLSLRTKISKLTVQAGLRTEYTRVKGKSRDLAGKQTDKPDTSYLNAFPTLFVQYKPGEKHEWGFSVSRRIDRPGYQDQNPFVYVLDAFNSEQGNPYLLPQLSMNYEMLYGYNNLLQIKLKYSAIRNYMEQVTYQTEGKTISIPQNVGSRRMYNLSTSVSVSPVKKWNLYASAEPFYQQYNFALSGFGFTDQLSTSSWGINLYMNNSYTWGKGWKAELSGWYNYQNLTTIYRSQPFYSLNMGISKKIWNEKGSIRISVTDPFNTQRWQQTAETKNIQLSTWRKWESRNITIGFSWRFGNTKIRQSRNRETATADEINRIK